MRIIPAIDIINGRCVRLTRGDYNTMKIYDSDPLEMALRFEDLGFSYLHLVDLDGAREKQVVNHVILESIASATTLAIDFGGGIKTDEDIRKVFDAGAASVNLGSIAVNDPELFLKWLHTYGDQGIILSADCRDRKIMTSGWTEKNEMDVVEYIMHYHDKGVKYAACTDIMKDGMLMGPSIELYRDIMKATDINLIASGGITTIGDIKALKDAGCEGAIIGKAIYEGNINLEELSKLC